MVTEHSKYEANRIPLSITNSFIDSDDVIDRYSPMSFIKFIKVVDFNYSDVELKALYHSYLAKWSKLSTNKDRLQQDLITEVYRDFIRDISITYTTNDEKKFLSALDFNNTRDLRVAVKFYGTKIKQIIKYYKEQRDTLEYVPTIQKISASVFGVERYLVDLISNFLRNQDSLISYNIDTVVDKLEVGIGELYNANVDIFNRDPDSNIPGDLDIDFGENIFLDADDETISRIFEGVSEDVKAILEADQLIKNKRDLTKKYIGTDLYYLSSNSIGEYETGKLLETDERISNISNLYYPTLVVIGEDQNIRTKQQTGVFTPDKLSILTIHAEEISFNIDESKIAPNTLLIYPDPSEIGNEHSAIIFSYSVSQFKYNSLAGKAANMPKGEPRSTTAIGYNSRPRPATLSYFDDDLNYIYDEGYVDDLKSDIYGNVFGIIKDNDNFKPAIVPSNPLSPIKSILLDGHVFYDTIFQEGYSFDYSISDNETYEYIHRSGIENFPTNGLTTLPLSSYTLFMREFIPYQELYYPTLFENQRNRRLDTWLYDGALFQYNNTYLPEPISSDYQSLSGDEGVYYYSILIEGGISSSDPLQRALLDPSFPSLTADFTQTVRYSGDDEIAEYDGGFFTDDNFNAGNVEYEYNEYQSRYYDTVFNTTSSISITPAHESYETRKQLLGQMYYRDISSNNVMSVIDTFIPLISARFNSSILNELSANTFLNFDILYSTLFLESPQYLTLLKYEYDGYDITMSHYPKMVIEHSTDDYNKISNRFKADGLDDDVYFFTTNILQDSLSATNNAIVYPKIYSYNYSNNRLTQIFPTPSLSGSDINSSLFSLSGGDVNIVEIESPTITYNQINRLFALSWIGKDQNKAPYIYTYLADIKAGDISFYRGDKYSAPSSNFTSIFDTGIELTELMSSISPTVINNTIII